MLIIAGVVLALIGTEFALRWFWPLADPYADDKLVSRPTNPYVPRSYPPNYVAEIRAIGINELPRSGRLSANSLGMRSPEMAPQKKDGVRRVVLIGGSAMECRHLDDDLTVRSALERTLASVHEQTCEVVFAGGWAARSYDHLASLAHRVFHLQPDLIVLASGLGDLFEALASRDYLLAQGTDTAERVTGRRLFRQLATEMQLGRFLAILRRPQRGGPETVTITFRGAIDWLYQGEPQAPGECGQVVPNLVPYRENLVSAVGMAAAHQTPLVLCTQPTLFMVQRPELGDNPWCWVNGKAFPRSEIAAAASEYNAVIRGVAAQFELPLCDLAETFEGKAEYFYDDFHYGRLGAAATAQTLAHFIVKESALQLAPRPAAMYSPRH